MFEADQFEDKISRILAGDYSLSGNNSLSSKNQRSGTASPAPAPASAPKREDSLPSSPKGIGKGIAQTASFISEARLEDVTSIAHSNSQQNIELTFSMDKSADLTAHDEIENMEIIDDKVSVKSSPTVSQGEFNADEEEEEEEDDEDNQEAEDFPVLDVARIPAKSMDSTSSKGNIPQDSGKGAKIVNPKIIPQQNDEQLETGSYSNQFVNTVLIPVSSPATSSKKKSEGIPVSSPAKKKVDGIPLPVASKPTSNNVSTRSGGSNSSAPNNNSSNNQQEQNLTPVRKTAYGSQINVPTPVESPSRFSTPNKMFSSPNSATSSVGVGERSVVVAVRVRPFSQHEKSQKARRTISKAGEDLVIVNPKAFDAEPDTVATAAIAIDHNPWAHAFRFDQCLWSYDPVTSTSAYIDQVGVHESIGYDIVDQALSGISCSCFAYGHTNTGKTYTLFGKPTASNARSLRASHSGSNLNLRKTLDAHTITEDSGLVPRVYADIITAIKSNQISTTNSRIFMSYLEIYNEKIVDLLSDNLPSKQLVQSNSSQDWGLKIREHPSYGVYVEGLQKFEIFCVEDMFSLLNKGNENRTTAQTVWNTDSSRSHAIVTLELASFDVNEAMKAIESSISFAPNSTTKRPGSSQKAQNGPSSAIKNSLEKSIKTKESISKEFDNFKTVRVQMVDLAGSEKDILKEDEAKAGAGSNYYDTTPNKQLEALEREKLELKQIRRSLATLGFIIQSLGRGASLRSLPYRDSKVTFLLRDALRGSNHTTMIATVSPAHIFYEETLATLRYAEKLCGLGKKVSINAGTTSIALPLREDRPQLIEEFRKYHSDIETARKSNLAARQLLQFTVADPQQRIARLTQPDESTAPTTDKKKKNQFSNADLTFTSPIDGKMKKIRDLTVDDLDTLQSTYRNLQGQVIELQIDLDAVKTDRDTLLIEVKGYKEQLQEIDHERKENNGKIANYIKSLKLAEKELNENRMLMKRKDEHIERLINELNETKQSKVNAEQAYHARTKEFLQRFDTLKKENKAMTQALEMANNRDGLYSSEKYDLINQLNAMKLDLEHSQEHNVELQTLNDSIQEDKKLLLSKVDRLEEIEELYNNLVKEFQQLNQNYSYITEEKELLITERDSLLKMNQQKDELLLLQNQQNEKSLNFLQSKHSETMNHHHSHMNSSNHLQQLVNNNQFIVNLQDYLLLQQNIKLLLHLSKEEPGGGGGIHNHQGNNLEQLMHQFHLQQQQQQQATAFNVIPMTGDNGSVTYTTSAGPILEASNLLLFIREIQEKYSYYKNILSLYENEKILRKELEKKLLNCLQLLKNDEILKQNLQETNNNLTKQINDLLYLQNLNGNNHNHNNNGNGNANNGGKDAAMIMEKPDNPFVLQIENLKKENSILKQQLETTTLNYTNSKNELLNTQKIMQKEFAQLWLSIKELTNLDSLKDKSIQELITERNAIMKERDLFANKNNMLIEQCNQLQRELREVDFFIEKASFAAGPGGGGGGGGRSAAPSVMSASQAEYSRALLDSLKQSRKSSNLQQYNYHFNEFAATSANSQTSHHQHLLQQQQQANTPGSLAGSQSQSHVSPAINPITVNRHPSFTSDLSSSQQQQGQAHGKRQATPNNTQQQQQQHYQQQQQAQAAGTPLNYNFPPYNSSSHNLGNVSDFDTSMLPSDLNEETLVQQVEQLSEIIDKEKMRRIQSRGGPGGPSGSNRSPSRGTTVESRSRVFSPNTRVVMN